MSPTKIHGAEHTVGKVFSNGRPGLLGVQPASAATSATASAAVRVSRIRMRTV